MKRVSFCLCLLSWVFIDMNHSQPLVPFLTTNFTNETQFQLFLENRTFEDAKGECERLDATLARISNEQEHDIVVDLLFRSNPNNGDDFWIGNQ